MILFPEKKYGVIYADPPWRTNRTARNLLSPRPRCWNRMGILQYDTMTDEEIYSLPVQSIVDKNCALFLWVTCPMLAQGLETVRRWGFEYRTTAFVWVKTHPNCGKIVMGLGSYTRGNAELVLLGTKGNCSPETHAVSQIIMAPREYKAHSRKPDEVRLRIEQLYPDATKIELFARERIPGWDCWGNETDKYTIPLAEMFAGEQ